MTTHPLTPWLRTRTPEPPPALSARIGAMATARADEEAAEGLVGSATAAMTTLLHDGCLTRESALDLLAVDALVTYAFEAAADDPDRLEARAEHALTSIAKLAEPYGA